MNIWTLEAAGYLSKVLCTRREHAELEGEVRSKDFQNSMFPESTLMNIWTLEAAGYLSKVLCTRREHAEL